MQVDVAGVVAVEDVVVDGVVVVVWLVVVVWVVAVVDVVVDGVVRVGVETSQTAFRVES